MRAARSRRLSGDGVITVVHITDHAQNLDSRHIPFWETRLKSLADGVAGLALILGSPGSQGSPANKPNHLGAATLEQRLRLAE